MKKTACILTYYRSNSFGAKLQACALYQYLLSLDIQPFMLDVRSTFERPFLIPYKIHHFQHCIRSFFSERFCRKYMPVRTKKYLLPSELEKEKWDHDYYIVGSDQVWNPTINREFCNAFFFDFVKSNAGKISYAASFGTADLSLWTEKQIADAKQLIQKFSAVSVRESQGLQICKNDFGIDAELACDPTFLMGASFFKTMIPHPEKQSKGGVVCFKLTGIGKDLEKSLSELAGIYGGGKCIAGWRKGQKIPGMHLMNCYSIPNWLQHIYSADFVVTDSFHAAVFSIMFHKPFLVTVGFRERMSRLTELLAYFGFSDRLCESDSDISKNRMWEKKMDFSATDRQMDEFRKLGVSFLQKALD